MKCLFEVSGHVQAYTHAHTQVEEETDKEKTPLNSYKVRLQHGSTVLGGGGGL